MSLIKAVDIRKKTGEAPCLDGVSFEIENVGAHGFLGKSGSGKTLLCEVLAGLSRPDGGRLELNGEELYASEKQRAAMKKRIGYVPQKSFFDADATVMEIMDLMGAAKGVDPDKRYRQIKEALELMGLSAKVDVLYSELSLSEKKRLSIAAAIIGNPALVIMDEPFRALDGNQAAEVERLLGMLARKKPVLIFSSNPSVIEQYCCSVTVIHEGRVMMSESLDTLLPALKADRLGGLHELLDALTEDKEAAK